MAASVHDIGTQSSYIIKEAFHDALRRYVRAVLECGEQTEESEMLVRSAYEALLKSGSMDDLAWAQDRLARAVANLDDGEYGLIHAHQANFERMVQALRVQMTINKAGNCVRGR